MVGESVLVELPPLAVVSPVDSVVEPLLLLAAWVWSPVVKFGLALKVLPPLSPPKPPAPPAVAMVGLKVMVGVSVALPPAPPWPVPVAVCRRRCRHCRPDHCRLGVEVPFALMSPLVPPVAEALPICPGSARATAWSPNRPSLCR